MGLYDTIMINTELLPTGPFSFDGITYEPIMPDGEIDLQTKTLQEPMMDTFSIDAGGRLIHVVHIYRDRTDEEYEQWKSQYDVDSAMLRIFGGDYRPRILDHNEYHIMAYHGDFVAYDFLAVKDLEDHRAMFDWSFRFTHGKLEYIMAVALYGAPYIPKIYVPKSD